MVTMLQLINHVGNGFEVPRMVTLVLKTSLAVDSQKNSKTKNWSHYSVKIRLKRKKILQIHFNDLKSSFRAIEIHGNNSKARQLGSVQVEVEERRFCSMSTVGPILQNRWKPTCKRWNGRFTPPAILSRRYSFRLPFVLIDGTRLGSSAFPLLWRSQKMDRFVDRLKRRIIFSRWNSKIACEMEKIHCTRWTILWLICFFHANINVFTLHIFW